MNQGAILSGVLGAWVLAVPARASAPLPRIKAPTDSLVRECLTTGSLQNGEFVRHAEWDLKCPQAEFLERLQKRDGSEDPALRLLFGRVLHAEIVKTRQEIIAQFAEKSRALSADAFRTGIMDVFHGFFAKTPAPSQLPPVQPFETAEGLVLAKTQALAERAEAELKPLFAGPTPSVLASEATLEMLGVLGDSLRFAAAADHIAAHYPLLQPSAFQREALRDLIEWSDIYGAPPLRPWLRTKLEALRPSEITGAKPEQLLYWIKSLELAGAPVLSADKTAALTRLRELWIAYPAAADAQKIRRLAELLGLSKEFHAPGTRDMEFKELMTRAQAQVRNLDGAAALNTLKRIPVLRKEDVDVDGIWSALQLHVRILRITDQRHLIPGVMRNYMRAGKFLAKPSDERELGKFFSRGVDLSRMAWSYDTPEKAADLLNRYLRLATAARGQESALGQLLYLKARMSEQEKDRFKARTVFAEALAAKLPNDLLSDLLWRNMLLHYDMVREGQIPPAELLALFESLKKVLQDPVDRARWHYWQGQSHSLAAAQAMKAAPGEESEKEAAGRAGLELALAEFEKSYKAEPYSFYSNLSGVELSQRGKKLSDWVLASEATYTEPEWKNYFGADGVPRLGVFRDLSRLHALARIGDFRGASLVALHEMDPALWDRILSSKSVVKDKRHYARAVAWLRLAIQDAMGSLKAAEIARQSYGPEFEAEDFLYLYPLPFWEKIQAEAEQRNVNPWLAASLIRQESAFDTRAKSVANALGLMQMIPSVANSEAKALGLKEFQVQDLYDPAVALKLGVFHLGRRVNEMEGSWICAAAAYNAGVPPVKKWLSNYDTASPVAFIERMSFAETRNYVRAILRNYMNYRRIYGGGSFELETIVRMPRSYASLTTPH